MTAGIGTGFVALLASLIPVFATIGCGFGLRRINTLEREAEPSLLRLAVNFLYPCFIAHTVLTSEALRDIKTVMVTPVTAGGILLLSYVIGIGVSRLIKLKKPHPHGSFVFAAGTQNWGYLPIPIIQTFFPQDLGILLLHSVGLELVLWSVGVYVLSGEGSWRKALNAPFFAILASLMLNICGAQLWMPGFILKTLAYLGQAAIPLSLILTGASLAEQVRNGGLYENRKALVAACVLRLLILPIVIIAAGHVLPIPDGLHRVLVVQAAMPGAMVPVILAKHYKADVGLSLGIVITTTLLGFLTIPLWLHIGFSLLGPIFPGYGH